MQVYAIIKPNSKHREYVTEADDGSLIIYTKSPAKEGKANRSAVSVLAEYYGVSKTQVELIRGHTARHKVFKVSL